MLKEVSFWAVLPAVSQSPPHRCRGRPFSHRFMPTAVDRFVANLPLIEDLPKKILT